MPDLETIATPALVVDSHSVIENVERMAAHAAAAGVDLRPHAKTHKSLEVAELQRAHGAVGLTVTTLREAEVFVSGGCDDVLIAAPPVGGWRLKRLSSLARDACVRVVVDDSLHVALLDELCRRSRVEIGYLWEVDCGVGRFGTAPGQRTAQLIADAVASAPSCSFDGLLAFGGHAYNGAVAAAAEDEREAIRTTLAALDARGIEARVRSIGTTPTAHVLENPAAEITEIRPGNYVFYDATQVALGVVDETRCALTVLTTVISRPTRTRVILDCGSKALAAERISPRTVGFGLVRGRPGLRIERLFEEQAIAVGDPGDLRIGDRVRVIPNHACAAVNLYERMFVVENGAVVDVWPVDARGWSVPRGTADRVAERL
jgi:D-serine deaminase-like pyridoxal phosphate-dependent protein